MFNLGQKVRVVDIEKIKNDPHLDADALKIIESSNFAGEVTKIEDDIFFVGFKNNGWVTQGFKADEISEVKNNGN